MNIATTSRARPRSQLRAPVATPGRARRARLALMAAGALLCAGLIGRALAADPPDGMEAVLTDAGGEQLVGYGVVQSGLLVLRLGSNVDRFVLLLVSPGGDVQRFEGVRGAGGMLLVDTDGGRRSLQELLGPEGIIVRTVRDARVAPGAGPAAGASDGGGGGGDSGGGGGDVGNDPGATPPGDDPGGDDGSGDGGGADDGGADDGGSTSIPGGGSGGDG